MTTVTLSWPDPEDASEFLRLRAEFIRQGWLPDPSRDELVWLTSISEVKDGSEDDGGGDG